MKVEAIRFIYDYDGDEVAAIGEAGKVTQSAAKKSIIDLIKKEKGKCDISKLVYKKRLLFNVYLRNESHTDD